MRIKIIISKKSVDKIFVSAEVTEESVTVEVGCLWARQA
jgi:hypothetical protein